jgi:rRNA-processing protein FCF1
MSVSVKANVVIKDACILFDLLDLSLLEDFYRLNLTVITTPEVIAQIENDEQKEKIKPYIDNSLLQIDRVGVLENILEILDNNPGLGLPDASVIEAAIRREATILSSDKSLKNESVRRGLVVRGSLWILEELYKQQILSLETVIEKLAMYPEVNKRAPKLEISNLVERLTKPKN